VANPSAKPGPRCYALIPLALHAGHAHWHREFEGPLPSEEHTGADGRRDGGGPDRPAGVTGRY